MLPGAMIPVSRHLAPMPAAGTGFWFSSELDFGQRNDHEASQAAPQNDFHHRFGDDDLGSRSDSENFEAASGDEQQDPNKPASKKKRYHRHTQHQIQELEAFFKGCPHPDDRQRKELGRELGLEPLQIKFWFQNKRTQTKAKHERNSNQMLRAENDKLRAENLRYKEALSSASCPNCGGPAALRETSLDEQQLRIGNAQLKEKIDRILGLAAKHAGKSTESHPLFDTSAIPRSMMDLGSSMVDAQHRISGEMFSPGELLKTAAAGTPQMERPLIIELAVNAMEELMKMVQVGEPLWFSGFDNATDALNIDEYDRAFPRGSGSKPLGWRTEATRGVAMVMMSSMSIVEILMDVNEWAAVFSGIVSRAVTMEVLSTGVAGNYNGALQVMVAEYQLPSPLVPIRECLFVRYCKQHSDGIWAVVDASLDSLRSNSSMRCRRQPSGCLVQEISNGYSKVTWVEHVEVDDRSIHPLYRLLVNSGLAFGAKRWIATLERQCERLASATAHNFPVGNIGAIATPEGRKNLLKLSERMVVSFFGGITASSAYHWNDVSEASNENVKVSMRKCTNDPGRPFGHVISAATSLWLPVAPRRLFDFLRDETSRNEWDILSNNAIIQEVAYIANGPEQGNCVSVLRVDNKNNTLILQESCYNTTGSYVINTPVDVEAMSLALSGGDPDYVALLPSGFAVLPDGPAVMHGEVINELGSGGSLLTIAFQILVDSPEKPDIVLRSVATVNQLISCTSDRIKVSILGDNIQKT